MWAAAAAFFCWKVFIVVFALVVIAVYCSMPVVPSHQHKKLLSDIAKLSTCFAVTLIRLKVGVSLTLLAYTPPQWGFPPIKRWKTKNITSLRRMKAKLYVSSHLHCLRSPSELPAHHDTNYFLIIVTAPSYSMGIRSGSRFRKSVYSPSTTSSWTVCKSFRPSSDIIPK